ncbi:OmpA/MotB family protein [Planktosalinus lacus]|uniref:Flagellar motor protein MotB n=1 Tax=Planktosalinus lacus TaxID=1526573 RepID=A0A8J2VA06_9FLAO|nr:OmpA family protein [Planktosalinus lacus]GGD91954.1 flagellar motor protein MotB [Planktosalinus lacus]
MKKIIVLGSVVALLFSSCVSQKKYAELEEQHKNTQDMLNTTTVKLNSCLEERASLQAKANSLESQVASLNATNKDLIRSIGDFTDLTKKGAENLERSLESLQEKDLTIRKLNDAVTRRDSVNLALVQSLKGAIGNLDDEDIEISVEKGVVYVNISDKLLFSSGSYNITNRAKEVLGKVAQVVKSKPDFEFLVEGHTDTDPISRPAIKDNWDLSVLRATAVVRMLQKDFGVDPARMTAGGRGEYVPVASNSTAEGKSKNRRTRIVVLPKLDQFYEMIEEGLKDPEIN